MCGHCSFKNVKSVIGGQTSRKAPSGLKFNLCFTCAKSRFTLIPFYQAAHVPFVSLSCCSVLLLPWVTHKLLLTEIYGFSPCDHSGAWRLAQHCHMELRSIWPCLQHRQRHIQSFFAMSFWILYWLGRKHSERSCVKLKRRAGGGSDRQGAKWLVCARPTGLLNNLGSLWRHLEGGRNPSCGIGDLQNYRGEEWRTQNPT